MGIGGLPPASRRRRGRGRRCSAVLSLSNARAFTSAVFALRLQKTPARAEPEARHCRLRDPRSLLRSGPTTPPVETSRGDTATATWIIRGDEPRRRRDVDTPRRRVAATPRLRAGASAAAGRARAEASLGRTKYGLGSPPWLRRGYSARGDVAETRALSIYNLLRVRLESYMSPRGAGVAGLGGKRRGRYVQGCVTKLRP